MSAVSIYKEDDLAEMAESLIYFWLSQEEDYIFGRRKWSQDQ